MAKVTSLTDDQIENDQEQEYSKTSWRKKSSESDTDADTDADAAKVPSLTDGRRKGDGEMEALSYRDPATFLSKISSLSAPRPPIFTHPIFTFTQPGWKNSALLDLTIGARVEFLRD